MLRSTVAWEGTDIVTGSGVAIFHLASSRVVVCYDTRRKFWFLPKGRRDRGECSMHTAEREGWEESGYRNRLLPLPIRHSQTEPHVSSTIGATGRSSFHNVVEPVLTILRPLPQNKNYLLHWYVAETLPPEEEERCNNLMTTRSDDQKTHIATKELNHEQQQRHYVAPKQYPEFLSLRARVQADLDAATDRGDAISYYEPLRHLNTGVNQVELCFTSKLVSVEEACQKLKEYECRVVRLAWSYLQDRWENERMAESNTITSGNSISTSSSIIVNRKGAVKPKSRL